MKEVLTKSFWQGVRKTFYDALEEPKPEDKSSQAAPAPEEKPETTSEEPPK